jgi:TPR repeat protein
MADNDDLRRAASLVEKGCYKNAWELLQPLIERDVAEAAYLGSRFAIPGESDHQFELRRLWLLHKATSLKQPDALYVIGVMYDCGDGALHSPEIASIYFRLAAIAGHARAKLSHGLDLCYGNNGIAQDKALGLSFLRQSAESGVDGAPEAIAELERLQGP